MIPASWQIEIIPEPIMSPHMRSSISQDPDEAVETLRDSLPQDTPANITAAFDDAMRCGEGTLPPRLYFEAAEQSPVAISITDLAANILYANPAFSRVTGYAPEEVLGRNESILSDKRTPPAIYATLWNCLRSREPWSGVLINCRKDGTRYLAELNIVPVQNQQGEVTHYLGMHRDITEARRLQQEVRSQKALIESVVEAAPVVIALLNAESRVVLANRAYEHLRQDLKGAEPAPLILAALRDVMGDLFERARSTGQAFDQEVRFDPGSDAVPRWFACSGTWVRHHDSGPDAFFEPPQASYLLLLAKDITALKRQQEEIRLSALRALLAEGELVQGMREALAGAIFRMQTPLNLVAAAATMLERRPGDDSGALLDVLRQALESGRQALETLRTSMPREPRDPRVPVDINQLLHEVLMVSTPRLLACGVVVDWRPAVTLPALTGQENRLRGMLKQVVENALDAMAERGQTRRELHLSTRVTDDVVDIIVQDTGPGIPERLRLRVFEPFFTTKGATVHSAGVGLTMAQQVVNEHGGTITIDPDYTEGCRVRIQLPRRQAREAED